ncbi:hypothetical protein [Ottowia sp.]|uniref:hypothetical protein n=1 Tax=Ottowia sp. TaxID=1898956 RepID=UPI0039E340F7
MLAPPDVQSLSDLVRRLRQWGLASGVAAPGFGLLASDGGLHAADSAHAGPRWMRPSPLAGGGGAALRAQAWRLERAL